MKKIKTSVFQLIMISVFSLFSFSACNNTPQEKEEQNKEKKVAEAENINKYKENFISFKGSDFKQGRLKQFVENSYVLDFLFRMKVNDKVGNYKYTETTPPMLGYFLPWNFYQVSANKIKIKAQNDISVNFLVKDMKWCQVQIISIKDKNTTRILIDGKELGSYDYFIPLEKKYIIGKGVKKRFWKGDIGFFRVYNYADLEKFPREYILNINKENVK
ncbi:MAG: LamG domain-containing protein [Bacteroidales bacterium]|nr:LamG domain-containing protein [Bacteroidales bacterium]